MANLFPATSGYRDPAKAMTLKALEARLKAAQEASIQSQQPVQIANPYQGAADILGSLGTQIQQGVAMGQLAQGRAGLAAVMSGVDPSKGADMAQIAQIGQYDPDLANRMYEAAMAVRNREDTQAFTAGESALERQQREALQKEREQFEGGQNQLQRQSTEGIAAAGQAGETSRLGTQIAANTALETQREGGAQELAKTNAALDTQKEKDKIAAGIAAVGPTADARLAEGEKLGLKGSELQRYAATGEMPLPPMVKPADMFTPAQRIREEALGKEAADWDTAGGANTARNIQQVGMAINLLKTKPGITGFKAGIAQNYLPDTLNKWYNPDGTVARDAIRETVQQTLRQVLGAQFTELEGESLMNRAFDASLGPQENIRRAELLMHQVQTIARNKQAMSDQLKNKGNFLDYQGGTAVDRAALQQLLDTDYGTTDHRVTGGGGGGAEDPNDPLGILPKP